MKLPDMAFTDKLKGYSEGMTISQMVVFFERHGISFTKTMIQNYVRVGVLPPPFEGRRYTKKHLLMLYMIDDFKNIFSLDEIKKTFAPVFASFESADLILFYNCYAKFYENCMLEYSAWLESAKKEIAKISDDSETQNFLSNLSMMAASSAAKKIALENID